MNEHLLEQNEKIYEKLNIPDWHKQGITGKRINIAVIGYGAIMADKKPYITLVNTPDDGGSYHDGDELINKVATDSKIYSINIFKKGWSFEQALKWILNNNIDVVCTSIELGSWDAEREELSKLLYEKNVIMIDSSDNVGKEDSIGWPAKSPYWYAVGSVCGRERAGYSSYGKDLDMLGYTDLAVHAQEDYIIPISHTSGTTQVVTGMVALLKQAYRIDNDGFREYIKNNSVDLDSKGWDKETGWGLFKLEEKPNLNKTIEKPIEKIEENKESENMPNTNFKDTQNHWAKDNINKIVNFGLMKGYEDNTFRPDGIVTRAELATILVRALKL